MSIEPLLLAFFFLRVSAAILMSGANVFALVFTLIMTPLLLLEGSVDCSTTVTPAAGENALASWARSA